MRDTLISESAEPEHCLWDPMCCHFSLGKPGGQGAQVDKGRIKQLCAVPCRCDRLAVPADCSPGTLGKQTKPCPEIHCKRGEGICGSHWQWKWEQVWAQQMGRQQQNLPHASTERLSSPCVWGGEGERAPMQAWSLCSPCSSCAPPKAQCVFPELCWCSLWPPHTSQHRFQML